MTYISTTPWKLERMEFGGDLGGWQEDLEEWAQSEVYSDDQLEEGCAMLMKEASYYTDTHVNWSGATPFPEKKMCISPPFQTRIFASASGEIASHEYCLDFIDSSTREPVNSTPDFELYAIPPMNAWWLPSPSGKFHSAEGRCGISHAKIKPGEVAKFSAVGLGSRCYLPAVHPDEYVGRPNP
ncbi:hypothetical protein OF83DRAFT_1174170 [Amylostereum chailletii]|nr:hypothetical protein OF83DRAFT_1174170 [Amylostereum chailletii]